MVLETAVLYVRPGTHEAFEKDFKIAGQYISSIPGCIQHSLQKCLEQKDKYLLLVEWEKLEDHTIGFRQSAVYEPWKKLLHHYYDPFPVVEHYTAVDI
ncbi:antibiotic biosynthesis monooxygenase family protein [Mucilaginibacter calamicampi]|uniref:Antibiotic biosynthesis monooxygenase family protein n=1 Tax=Mucilaginibacter calamicampi TaxID=1302352 RepID=A0ABW2YV54_9SPHI